jgi:uncharacterized membrane protein YphA (DoxX/SURF4 family)
MSESLTGTHGDWVVAVARIVLGIVFFAHGAQKNAGMVWRARRALSRKAVIHTHMVVGIRTEARLAAF